MEFVIGSINNAKVKAATIMVNRYFPGSLITSVDVASGVNNQPYGDVETRNGALNRARNAALTSVSAIGIGLEGGVRMLEGEMYVCNWGALVLPTGKTYTAAGAQIPLPAEIANGVKAGKELGIVVDDYFHGQGIRHSEGAIGMLTAQTVTRDQLFEHVLQLLCGQYLYEIKLR